ncbi:MAG: hypothetical protein R8J94_00705 [Acidimicrobiia bacterium]|nr:hypothetical protein [Acidimicrobiia bacterium]
MTSTTALRSRRIDSRARRLPSVALLFLLLALGIASCSSESSSSGSEPERQLGNQTLSRVLGEPGDAAVGAATPAAVAGEQQTLGEPDQATGGSTTQEGSEASDGGSPVPERGEIVRSEDDLDLTEPEPELVEESITIDDAIEELGVETPCDLYTTPALRTQMTQWSQTAGLTDDLPNGLLTPGSEISFEPATQTSTECSWFSEAQLWSLQITFQPASGFTDELYNRGAPLAGIGDRASLQDDTTGSLEVGDLFVTVTNLPPGHTQTTNDRTVVESMLTDIATKLT